MTSRRSIALWLGTLALTSCAEHTINEGLWRLEWQAQDLASGLPVDVEPTDVRVEVDWNENPKYREQIALRATQKSTLTEIWGDIAENGKLVEIRGQDRFMSFRLSGTIKTPDEMSGDFWMGAKEDPGTSFIGRWTLSRVGD